MPQPHCRPHFPLGKQPLGGGAQGDKCPAIPLGFIINTLRGRLSQTKAHCSKDKRPRNRKENCKTTTKKTSEDKKKRETSLKTQDTVILRHTLDSLMRRRKEISRASPEKDSPDKIYVQTDSPFSLPSRNLIASHLVC
jgi:hypothetical protein